MKTIEIRWSTEDVLMKAEEMDIELTEEQADIILDNIERHHDACVGINWDVIDYHIETYVMENNV
jgi:acyl-homoserine lactone acylase PvdQ